MSQDLHVAPLMQGISRILYLVEILFLFFFPILLCFLRMEIEMRSHRSVVTSQVNHVVRLSVSAVSSVSACQLPRTPAVSLSHLEHLKVYCFPGVF